MRLVILTDILPRRVELIEVIQIGQSTEELGCAAHLEPDDNPAFTAAFHFEDLDNGAVSLLDIPHDSLVDLDRVRCGFLEEHRVRDGTNVSFAIEGLGLLVTNELVQGDKGTKDQRYG